MKNEIYITIALLFFVSTIFFCVDSYIKTRKLNADNCGHAAITEGVIVGSTMNGLNENGEDVSCYIDFRRDGRLVRSEEWNIGNCDVGRTINIDYNSYVCL